ncbi:universal stress protein [Candidatus Bathyarchaeota archaeon]|nr:universal stress protein [Candidatus Bathyarchaeota archaeon]
MFDPVFSKILVAYDGSEASDRALDSAAKMAAMFKGEIIIITVVPRVSMPIISTGEMSYMELGAETYQEKLIEAYSLALEKAKEEMKEHYPQIKIEAILKEGRPSELIVAEADLKGASLIVMGSRGIGGISGWILGSTSRKVVDHCTKPILIVK